jgi:hypothetical protein
VEFVELALKRGYDDALRQTFGHGIGELERKWHRSLEAPSRVTVGARGQARLETGA